MAEHDGDEKLLLHLTDGLEQVRGEMADLREAEAQGAARIVAMSTQVEELTRLVRLAIDRQQDSRRAAPRDS